MNQPECRKKERDPLTPEQRHKNMAAIRSKDTSIEVKLRKALWHHGYRYRKNYTALPGSPDIAITKHRIAIFCDSEFFHGKDWDKLKLRLENGSNSTYWIKKIVRNTLVPLIFLVSASAIRNAITFMITLDRIANRTVSQNACENVLSSMIFA